MASVISLRCCGPREVKDGSFAGNVVQQPYEWGYQSMKLMAAYLEGDQSK